MRDLKTLTIQVKKISNEHVAILDETVVDHDKDLKMLMERIRLKYPEAHDRVATKFISPEKIELILPYPG